MIKRYWKDEIKRIFTDEFKYRKWYEVELAVAEAEASLGIIPGDVPDVVKEKMNGVDFSRVSRRAKEIEKEVDHDVIAFLLTIEEIVGESARYLHYGLTSSDVVDTANSMILREALELNLNALNNLIESVKNKAVKYKYQPIMGRTHGVFAEPTSLGLKFLSYYSAFLRDRENLIRAIEMTSFGKISGAVGNYSFISPEVEKFALEKLGLKAEPVSTQIIPRDRYAFVFDIIAISAGNIEKFATEIRLLQRTEVGELEEPFRKKQRGSSAMPHKRNPIKSERLCGLARLLRGYALTAMENIALWHERDISHSSTERFIIPDALSVYYYALGLLKNIIDDLVVNVERINENLVKYGKFYLSEAVLLALVQKGVPRGEAYEWVKESAHQAMNTGLSFEDLIRKNEKIRKHLSDEEIEEALSHNYLKNVDEIFARFGI